MTIQLQALAATHTGAAVTLDCFNRCNTDPFVNLLPVGAMWPRDEGTKIYEVCSAMSIELGRVDCQVRTMLAESYPDTAQQTLTHWEDIAGIPDSCDGVVAGSVSARQDAVVAVFRQDHVLNDAYWGTLAGDYGYPAPTITKNTAFCVGVSCAGDPLCPLEALLTTTMTFPSGPTDALLECKIRKKWPPYAPLTVIFI